MSEVSRTCWPLLPTKTCMTSRIGVGRRAEKFGDSEALCDGCSGCLLAATWFGCDFRHKRVNEQAGRRPALVLSPLEYNRRTGLMLCCPITSQVKGYPFEVPLPAASPIEGVILADRVR